MGWEQILGVFGYGLWTGTMVTELFYGRWRGYMKVLGQDRFVHTGG